MSLLTFEGLQPNLKYQRMFTLLTYKQNNTTAVMCESNCIVQIEPRYINAPCWGTRIAKINNPYI